MELLPVAGWVVDWPKVGEILLGVILSLATSFAFFYWQFHVVVPEIRFSEKISKLKRGDGGFRYRVKFENCGKRDIVEVTVLGRLRVKALNPNALNNWNIAEIPMGFVVPLMRPVKQSRLRETPEIDLRQARFERPFPKEIVDRAHADELPLEELLRLGTKTTLEIFVFGYDAFSGSRKVFVSKVYSEADIAEGPFEPGSLEIGPAS